MSSSKTKESIHLEKTINKYKKQYFLGKKENAIFKIEEDIEEKVLIQLLELSNEYEIKNIIFGKYINFETINYIITKYPEKNKRTLETITLDAIYKKDIYIEFIKLLPLINTFISFEKLIIDDIKFDNELFINFAKNIIDIMNTLYIDIDIQKTNVDKKNIIVNTLLLYCKQKKPEIKEFNDKEPDKLFLIKDYNQYDSLYYNGLPLDIIKNEVETTQKIEAYKKRIYEILKAIDISKKIIIKNDKNWELEHNEIINNLFINEKIYNNFLNLSIKNGIINYNINQKLSLKYKNISDFTDDYNIFFLHMHGVSNNRIFKLPKNVNIVFAASVGYYTGHTRNKILNLVDNIITYWKDPTCLDKNEMSEYENTVMYYGGQYCLDVQISKKKDEIHRGLFKRKKISEDKIDNIRYDNIIESNKDYKNELSDFIEKLSKEKDDEGNIILNPDKIYTIVISSCRAIPGDALKMKNIIYFERINKIMNFVIEQSEKNPRGLANPDMFLNCMTIKKQIPEKIHQATNTGKILPIPSILTQFSPRETRINNTTLERIKKQLNNNKNSNNIEEKTFQTIFKLLFKKIEEENIKNEPDNKYEYYISYCYTRKDKPFTLRCNILTLKKLYYLLKDKETILKYINKLIDFFKEEQKKIDSKIQNTKDEREKTKTKINDTKKEGTASSEKEATNGTKEEATNGTKEEATNGTKENNSKNTEFEKNLTKLTEISKITEYIILELNHLIEILNKITNLSDLEFYSKIRTNKKNNNNINLSFINNENYFNKKFNNNKRITLKKAKKGSNGRNSKNTKKIGTSAIDPAELARMSLMTRPTKRKK